MKRGVPICLVLSGVLSFLVGFNIGSTYLMQCPQSETEVRMLHILLGALVVCLVIMLGFIITFLAPLCPTRGEEPLEGERVFINYSPLVARTIGGD